MVTFKDVPPSPLVCNGDDEDYTQAYFVSARSKGGDGVEDMAFTWSDWQRGIEPWRFNVPTHSGPRATERAHTIFDRTLFRAGETVSMKHLLRTETRKGFGLPDARPETLVITHLGSGQQFTQPLAWRGTATGGLSAQSSFAIPPAAKLGVYQVELRNDADNERSFGSGEFRVETEQGNVTCEHLVNAAGCYAREVGKWLGVDTPITNMEHQYLVTEPLAEFKDSPVELPVMRDPATAGYYRQEQKAGLVGIYEHTGAREAWASRGGWPEWSSENELFEGDLDRIAPWLEKALERMPIFANAGIKRIINGAIPHTPDGNPLVGPMPGVPNAWQCCGSSIGIAQGAGCGKFLAQWMIHGDAEINMASVDPRRFGAYADQDYTRAKSFDDYENMFETPLPGREVQAGRPRRITPLFEVLKAKGAVMTEVHGWERPKYFAPVDFAEKLQFRRTNTFDLVAAECRAVRERVGIMDLSSFAKFDVAGPGAEALLDRLTANRLPKKLDGIGLTQVLSDNGRILGEWTITRLGPDRFYLLTGAGAEEQARDDLAAQIDHAFDKGWRIGNQGRLFVAAYLLHLENIDAVLFGTEGEGQVLVGNIDR